MNQPSAAPTRPHRRPVLSALGIIGGVLAGLGITVLLQQYGVRPMTRGLLITGVVVGALTGIALPTVARLLALSRARTPVAATIPAASDRSADETPPVPGWVATHEVPPEGMWAWESPDPASQPSTSLEAGLPVRLDEQREGWAHVTCSTGWTTWVDARQLVPHPEKTSAPPASGQS